MRSPEADCGQDESEGYVRLINPKLVAVKSKVVAFVALSSCRKMPVTVV